MINGKIFSKSDQSTFIRCTVGAEWSLLCVCVSWSTPRRTMANRLWCTSSPTALRRGFPTSWTLPVRCCMLRRPHEVSISAVTITTRHWCLLGVFWTLYRCQLDETTERKGICSVKKCVTFLRFCVGTGGERVHSSCRGKWMWKWSWLWFLNSYCSAVVTGMLGVCT